MKSKTLFTAGASALAIASLFLAATEASAKPVYRPTKQGIASIDPNLPIPHIGPHTAPYLAPPGSQSGTWKDLTATLPFANGPWVSLLQTDGTVLIDDYCTGQWYRLSPNKKGKYEKGKFKAIASMPSGYGPIFFASQVLTDGRMIVNGGEYNFCNADWTNLGALYDPATNSWSSVTAPSGWTTIGDAQSVILPNGTYMLANCCSSQAALASISGTNVTWTVQNSSGYNDEQAFNMLPDGNLITVDVWNHGSNFDATELYDRKAGTWSAGPNTADYLSTSSAYELGPAVLRPDKTLIQFSANPTIAVNDIYSFKTGKWSSGPVLSVGGTKYDCADSPGVELPSGNTLVQASPGIFSSPSHFWEVGMEKNGSINVTQVSDPSTAGNTSSFEGTFVMLPTGQALWTNSQVSPKEVATYTPKGKPKAKWLPVVSSVNGTLNVGSTGNAISGTNFNGFSLGATYGDDGQMASNFPIVRITNNGTGDVCYAKSYNFSTMGVFTSGTTNATFDIPAGCETGASTLQAVVNGIASVGTAVTLN